MDGCTRQNPAYRPATEGAPKGASSTSEAVYARGPGSHGLSRGTQRLTFAHVPVVVVAEAAAQRRLLDQGQIDGVDARRTLPARSRGRRLRRRASRRRARCATPLIIGWRRCRYGPATTSRVGRVPGGERPEAAAGEQPHRPDEDPRPTRPKTGPATTPPHRTAPVASPALARRRPRSAPGTTTVATKGSGRIARAIRQALAARRPPCRGDPTRCGSLTERS